MTECLNSPPPRATEAPPLAPEQARAAALARLHYLFRRSLLRAQVHPLQAALMQHRGLNP